MDPCSGVPNCTLDTTTKLPTVVVGLINAAITIATLVCVIMIVKGGIMYMESTGDPGKVKTAKTTILYSVIGLVICALAFVIVNFVLGAIK